MEEVESKKIESWKPWERVIFVFIWLSLGMLFYATLTALVAPGGYYSFSDAPFATQAIPAFFFGFIVLLLSLIIVKRLRFKVFLFVVLAVVLGVFAGSFSQKYADTVVNNRIDQAEAKYPLSSSIALEKTTEDLGEFSYSDPSVFVRLGDKFALITAQNKVELFNEKLMSVMKKEYSYDRSPKWKYLYYTMQLSGRFEGDGLGQSGPNGIKVHKLGTKELYVIKPQNNFYSLLPVDAIDDTHFLVRVVSSERNYAIIDFDSGEIKYYGVDEVTKELKNFAYTKDFDIAAYLAMPHNQVSQGLSDQDYTTYDFARYQNPVWDASKQVIYYTADISIDDSGIQSKWLIGMSATEKKRYRLVNLDEVMKDESISILPSTNKEEIYVIGDKAIYVYRWRGTIEKIYDIVK
jgi:hypothetical protein